MVLDPPSAFWGRPICFLVGFWSIETDFKKSQNIGFFELRSEVSGMVLVDRKVVSIDSKKVHIYIII